jgi:hypothetical protein
VLVGVQKFHSAQRWTGRNKTQALAWQTLQLLRVQDFDIRAAPNGQNSHEESETFCISN